MWENIYNKKVPFFNNRIDVIDYIINLANQKDMQIQFYTTDTINMEIYNTWNNYITQKKFERLIQELYFCNFNIISFKLIVEKGTLLFNIDMDTGCIEILSENAT
jgi:anaerobic ribonucleoside-triphosphate reductase